MAPDRIQSIIAQYFAATRAMDPEAWVACFAENATSYEPAALAPIKGYPALRQFFLGIAGAFQKIGMTEDHGQCRLFRKSSLTPILVPIGPDRAYD